MIHVSRVALDWVVDIGGNAILFQLAAEEISCRLTGILGDDH